MSTINELPQGFLNSDLNKMSVKQQNAKDYEQKKHSEIVKVDFAGKRKERQNENIKETLKHINDNDLNEKNCNKKALDRVLQATGCENYKNIVNHNDPTHIIRILLAMSIAKNASRQGSIDEKEQIYICSEQATKCKCSFEIKQLPNKEKRPLENSDKIITRAEMRKKKINKDQKTLKSFDAEITGSKSGFISAKICFNSGGHQDNVFKEEINLAKWWVEYYSKTHQDEILVLLIDTNLDKKLESLKTNYHGEHGILILNHVEFQEYIIVESSK